MKYLWSKESCLLTTLCLFSLTLTPFSFSFFFVIGKLPPALSLLTSLQHLDLYNNLVTGAIPAEYKALVALKDLYLGGNPSMAVDRAALHAMLPNCRLRL